MCIEERISKQKDTGKHTQKNIPRHSCTKGNGYLFVDERYWVKKVKK